jgi:AcrR family transcriptional regulator
VPRRVDHEQRRRELASALFRIACTRGLHAASLREVAAEAGVSMRLVQYYFQTTDQMRLFALEYLTDLARQRMLARLATLSDAPRPSTVLRVCLMELLPTDEDSLMTSRVHAAYHAAALTDPGLAAAEGANPAEPLEKAVAGLIRKAQQAGETAPELDADAEAGGLVSMVAGLAAAMLVGGRTAESAVAILEYHLDRLFAGRVEDKRGSTGI